MTSLTSTGMATATGGWQVPPALGPLVGRAGDLAGVESLLGRSRLVTLTGPTGVGKSRLAAEAARLLAGSYGGGVWFYELGDSPEAALVGHGLAGALLVGGRPGRQLVARLAQRVGQRRLLLVLDDCDRSVAWCAALAEALLGRCGGLSVLATSPEPLALGGEVVWPVAPLPAPSAAERSAAAMVGCASVTLFLDRVRAAVPGFALDEEVAPAVGEICRRLDGLPLALELAAARVPALSPAEIAARLGDPFALLTGGRRHAPARHRSLRGALDWGHGLLPGPERALLRRLSVFAAGFTLAAAVAVCDDGAEEAEVLDRLGRLVARSLVLTEPAADGATRYRLLETVRHHAGEQLAASGEGPGVRARFGAFSLELVQRAEAGLGGAGRPAATELLEAEGENLDAALGWALSEGGAEAALGMVAALAPYWLGRGQPGRATRWLEAARVPGAGAGTAGSGEARVGRRAEAAGVPGDQAPVGLRAKAGWAAGLVRSVVDGPRAGLALAEEALGLARGAGDAALAARSSLLAGSCRLALEGPAHALPVLGESVRAARAAGDTWCVVQGLAESGLGRQAGGEPAAARQLLDECVELARRSEDARCLVSALGARGRVAVCHGDHGVGQRALAEALGLARALGDPCQTAMALTGLADGALARGDHDRARPLVAEALASSRQAGAPGAIVAAVETRGRLAQAEGDLDGARRCFEAALRSAPEPALAIAALVGLGAVLGALGDLEASGDVLERARSLAAAGGRKDAMAASAFALGQLSSAAGAAAAAVSSHCEALQLRAELSDVAGIADSLEAIAGLKGASAAGGQRQRAVRLLAAAQSLRHARGRPRPPAAEAAHQQALAELRALLPGERFAAAWAQGATMSVPRALAYAGAGPAADGDETAPAWAGLSRTQQSVAALIAQGLTNAEIAERLFVSPDTVKGHVASVLAKLQVSSRRQLLHAAPPRPGLTA